MIKKIINTIKEDADQIILGLTAGFIMAWVLSPLFMVIPVMIYVVIRLWKKYNEGP